MNKRKGRSRDEVEEQKTSQMHMSVFQRLVDDGGKCRKKGKKHKFVKVSLSVLVKELFFKLSS